VLWAHRRRILTLKRCRFTREFKLQVLREIETGKTVAQAAREHEIHPNLITKWRSLRHQYVEHAFAGNGNTYKLEARVAELERRVGRLTMDNDSLNKALALLESTKRQFKEQSK
jgi:transposase